VVAGGELTSEIVERAVAVLADRPSALVTDIDGTLSRIVPRPEDASVSTRARSALQTLVRQLDLVAVITGRPNEVARRMVGVEGIVYMGSYALDAASRVSLAESDLGLVRQLATGLLAEHPCVRLEEKEVSFALHYRNCDHPEHVGDALLEALAPLAESAAARLLEGKRVIEVAPAALPDKDVAFAKLAADYQVRGAIFLGDDGADASIFRAIAGRRDQGFSGLAIAVRDAETPASVVRAADAILEGVDEVEEFLEALVTEVGSSTRWPRAARL
jgi:trehalose 6-phosphate phosphatase